MRKTSAFAIGAALAVGAFCTVSRLAAPDAQPESDGAAPAAPSRQRAKPSVATQKRLEKLRSRVKELEALVAQREQTDEKPTEPEGKPGATDAARADAPKSVDLVKLSRQRSSRRDSLLKLKDANPDAFARAVESISASAKKTTQAAQKRIGLFSNIDESRLTEDELSAHREVLALLEAQQEVARLRTQWDVDADVEFSLNREASEIEGKLRELYSTERKALLRQAAHEYGYENEDAESFSHSLDDILSATQGDIFHY